MIMRHFLQYPQSSEIWNISSFGCMKIAPGMFERRQLWSGKTCMDNILYDLCHITAKGPLHVVLSHSQFTLRSLSLSAQSALTHPNMHAHTQKVHLTVKALNTHSHTSTDTHTHTHTGLWKVPGISCLLSQLQVFLLVQVAATMTTM